MLSSELAEHIVRETMSRLNRNINIMDAEGTILASGIRERVGERHAAAAEAVLRGETIAIEPGDRRMRDGVQPGINMPIVFRGRVVGAIGITGLPEEVAEFAELVRMTTELMLEQAFMMTAEENRSRIAASFFAELEAPSPDVAVIRSLLQLLEVEPREPCRICVAQWSALSAEAAGRMPSVLRALTDIWGARRCIAAFAAERREIRIASFGCSESAWEHLLARTRRVASFGGANPPRIGASGASGRIEELDFLLEEALFAASRSGADNEIIRFPGLEPEWLLATSAPRAKRRYAERIAAGLPESLRETLRAYFAFDMNVQASAESLFVHKNTVLYRLNKIKERTGLDPQSFRDAVALQMALWCRPD